MNCLTRADRCRCGLGASPTAVPGLTYGPEAPSSGGTTGGCSGTFPSVAIAACPFASSHRSADRARPTRTKRQPPLERYLRRIRVSERIVRIRHRVILPDEAAEPAGPGSWIG